MLLVHYFCIFLSFLIQRAQSNKKWTTKAVKRLSRAYEHFIFLTGLWHIIFLNLKSAIFHADKIGHLLLTKRVSKHPHSLFKIVVLEILFQPIELTNYHIPCHQVTKIYYR